MSEHTPGPWKVDSKYCVGPVSQEDDQSYGMIIPVADVYGPNRKADAELIASAPQLREQNRVLAEAFAKTTKGTVTINRYEHGGGRMFVDDGKNRDLIADTYNEGDREFIALCYEVFSKQASLTATSQLGGHDVPSV